MLPADLKMFAFQQNICSSSILLPRKVACKNIDYVYHRRVTFPQNKRVAFPRIISRAAAGDNAKEEIKNVFEDIKEKGADVYHAVEENIKQGAEKVSDKVNELKEAVNEKMEDMNSGHSSTKERAKEVVDKLQETGQSAMEDMSEAKKKVEEKWEDWKQEHK
ncbi:hypothetical protein Gasu2_19230 [Galdieria sulphuraria]|uniref:Uncharacterized protein n=1 Tax=Galdieria sulphuraria TaxID=130081 RepID=M2XUW5_GALSU|nr:uncharacterized protein Gasu_51850 [Galdieria sulphuraria]EME27204.1 hypothetical protein Gasu_51850 [Galdieria sulphuraria]GJD07571.1 hypothetical protein Gasu2_19230 [Galdieria sulphuraria]|eukprot:XP_005703724.1 hypothetical protein Gasu_51850 [Galdieria sulphuraria]